MEILKMKRKVIIKIIDKIKLKFKVSMLKRNKKVIFNRGSMTDLPSYFEGKNRLAKGSSLFNSRIGVGSYLGENTHFNNAFIGKYTCIGPRVDLIIGQHPTNIHVSVHPSFFSVRKQVGFTYVDKGTFSEFKYVGSSQLSVKIGNDVWIGSDVKIMEGITIGDGAIIAAGAIVNNDIPSYSIYGGVPAKLIRYRFNDKYIKFLLEFKWWDRNEEWIKSHAAYFNDVEQFHEIISKSKTNNFESS